DALRPMFQKIVDLTAGEAPYGFESLARLQTPALFGFPDALIGYAARKDLDENLHQHSPAVIGTDVSRRRWSDASPPPAYAGSRSSLRERNGAAAQRAGIESLRHSIWHSQWTNSSRKRFASRSTTRSRRAST